MTLQTHTPYDGSSPPFTIGLARLDPAEWIDADDRLLAYLDEKDRLMARHGGDIFMTLPGSEAGQAEVLGMLAEHLPARFPDIYQRVGPQIDIVPAFRRVRLDGPLPPLLVAASLVQEDLILMHKSGDDWCLQAGALAFPSSWVLREKIGLPMHEVHAPVPGFHKDTRNAGLIARMFDNLRPEQPVVRWNWSLYGDDALYHPESGNPVRRFGDGEIAQNVFLRLERQTLRKLPLSGDIVFAIRIHVDPLGVLDRHPDGANLARAMAAQIAALTPEQLAYKGLTHERERLLARLATIAD